MVVKNNQPILPGPQSERLFTELEHVLGHIAPGEAELVGPNDERTAIPDALYEVIRQAVAALKQGHGVSVVPANEELTSQQAADLLNVSRPFLTKLLDRGDIPFRLSGGHRRIELQELLQYREERSIKRREALRQLAHDAESRGTLAS